MLAVIVSWIIISFVLLSFGDIFISLYNKLCKQEEQYNLVDTLILGMCFTLVPLSLSSLWLPSNHYILFAYIAVSIIYWCFNKQRLAVHYGQVRTTIIGLTALQKILVILSVVSIATYILWSSSFYDAAYYHYQSIRWNEEYAIVPGLGNIEDRLAFNSNYLLISAIFSFRFLFGEAVYTLQSLLFTYIFCWVLISVFKSKFNVLNIILLFATVLLFIANGSALTDTNTDVIPNLCIFYILARITLQPDWYKKQSLLVFLLPVVLVTFKLSTFVFCFISLFTLIYLAKHKKVKPIIFILTISTFIVILWFVRNIIISGYLVYPVYQIDLFNFDWKMPKGTAMLQYAHIGEWARYVSRIDKFKLQNLFFLIPVLSCIFVALSPPVVLYTLLKKKEINRSIYIFYFISILNFIFWYISAPDFRFINGCALGCSFLISYIVLSFWNKGRSCFPKTGNIVSVLIIAYLLMYIAKENYKSNARCNALIEKQHSLKGNSEERRASNILYMPYPTVYLLLHTVEDYKKGLGIYKMENIDMYLTHVDGGETFDVIPTTGSKGLPYYPFNGGKVQSITTIEPRGNTIQDGFRTKRKYIDIINNNVSTYKQKYIDLRYIDK